MVIDDVEKVSVVIVFVILYYKHYGINDMTVHLELFIDVDSDLFAFRKNMNYSSTCNALGIPIGMFIGSVCFTLLVSEKFSDKILHRTPGSGGLVTMKSTANENGLTTLTP